MASTETHSREGGDTGEGEMSGIHMGSSTAANDNEIHTTTTGNPGAASADTIAASSIFFVQEAYKATAVPVTITMILSALATNYVSTEESSEAREATITSSYSVIHVSDDATSTEELGIGLVNGLVIIAAITAMTFLVVLLYKYKCMLFLKGYLVVSITFLLGYFGAVMFQEAILTHSLWVTKISFALIIYNFTIVGVYALFHGKGVPVYVVQGYLIAVSVILAWQLSHFSELMAWILLVLLALYDLFAVLTPCGPLKCLVDLMGQDGAHQIPALLYEAQLPPEARRKPASNLQPQRRSIEQPRTRAAPQTSNEEPMYSNSQPAIGQDVTGDGQAQLDERPLLEPPQLQQRPQLEPPQVEPAIDDDEKKTEFERLGDGQQQHFSTDQGTANDDQVMSQIPREVVVSPRESEFEAVSLPTGTVPLAIAKLYKLILVDGTATDGDNHTSDELKAHVQVYYPRNGGRIEPLPTPPPVEPPSRSRFGFRRLHHRKEPNTPVKYNVVDRHGVIKRTIFVGEDGKVYRVLDEVEQEEEERRMPSNIKLGLVR
jgi:Presenilin